MSVSPLREIIHCVIYDIASCFELFELWVLESCSIHDLYSLLVTNLLVHNKCILLILSNGSEFYERDVANSSFQCAISSILMRFCIMDYWICRNDGLLAFVENFVKDHFLPTMFVDYRKGVQQAISSKFYNLLHWHYLLNCQTCINIHPIIQFIWNLKIHLWVSSSSMG